MGIAIINYLLIEKDLQPEFTGIVGAVFSLGFVVFTMFAGNVYERMGRERLLFIISIACVACSIGYLIPITDPITSIIFLVVRCLDGGFNGLFWATVQSYAKLLSDVDARQRNTFTARYNLSWNMGVIGGTVAGWILTQATATNIYGFYVNIFIACIQLIVVSRLAPARILFSLQSRDAASNDVVTTIPSNRPLTKDELATIGALKPALVYLALLTHSFTTGALSLFVPATIKNLALPSFITYVFFFIQSIAQTTSMTATGHAKERWIVPAILIMPATIGTCWISFGFHASNVGLVAIIAVLAVAQGMLYTSGMRFLTSVAQASRTSSTFSRFQFTMGFGRMAGPFIFGFLIPLGMSIAAWVVGSFDMLLFATMVVVLLARKQKKDA